MLKLNDKYIKLVNDSEKELSDIFSSIEENTFINSKKVLDAFHRENISESDLNGTSGYGYNDTGRDKIERIFSYVLDSEDALVRTQIISGTHAISTALFAILRPGDTLLAISGTPYDTLHEVIGIKPNNSSLISYGIKYKEVNLIDNDFDYDKIEEELKNTIKAIHIQRSRGYSLRDSLTIDKLEKVIKFIKNINKDVIIFVDNCYCDNIRDRALFELMFATGCRLSEIQKMNISDIDFITKSIKVLGKGNKERIVYFNDKAKLYLNKYLKTRMDNSDALFVGKRKPYKRIGNRAIENIIKKIKDNSDINRSEVCPHLLRHTMATISVNAGIKINSLQKLLGHENISTTQIYAETNMNLVKNEYDQKMLF